MINDFFVFEFQGKDSADFLHRISSLPAKTMPEKQGHPGFILNPKGQIEAHFYGFKLSPDLFYLIGYDATDSEWKNKLREKIDFYTFSEQVVLTDVSARLEGVTMHSVQNVEEKVRGQIHFSMGGPPSSTLSVFLPSVGIEKAKKVPFSAKGARELGIPLPGQGVSFENNPLECGFGAWFVESKGCYPGQEVIEKIVAIGSPARRLALVESTLPGDFEFLFLRKTELALKEIHQKRIVGLIA